MAPNHVAVHLFTAPSACRASTVILHAPALMRLAFAGVCSTRTRESPASAPNVSGAGR